MTTQIENYNKNVKDINYRFKSGRFRAKTVSEVIDINPDYLVSLHYNKDINISFTADVLYQCYKSQLNQK